MHEVEANSNDMHPSIADNNLPLRSKPLFVGVDQMARGNRRRDGELEGRL